MAVPTSLMDLSQSFPLRYSVTLGCSKEDLPQKIEEVATFVSKVYARFPRSGDAERIELRELGFILQDVRQLPTLPQCEQFENTLKQRIVVDLTKDVTCQLAVKYRAEGGLLEVAKSAFKDVTGLFPFESSTFIFRDRDGLHLSMMLCSWV